MTVIGLGSVRGAPGVTTTAHLLASALDPALLIEADLAGGSLAVRYRLGREPGLTTFATTRPGDPESWRGHAQDAGGVPVIVGPDVPETARSLWDRAGHRIAVLIDETDRACVVDLGRLGGSIPLAAQLDPLIVLVRPVEEDLVTLCNQLTPLRRQSARLAVVLVGDGDYSKEVVEMDLSIEVLGALPYDRRTAEVLGGRGRAGNLNRTPLVRAVMSLADSLAATARSGLDAETVS